MASGLSPQFIMRASLTRHIAEITKPESASDIYWQKPEYQRRSGESEIENLGWSEGYAEPGYTANPRGVLTANWNYFHHDITDLLERAGFSCEWSDEWTQCDQCGKLYRTSGDCWEWQQYGVVMNECENICLDCVDWTEYLESIEDNPNIAVPRRCNPAEHGYHLLSKEGEYENGFHPGQNDDPKKILANLQANGYAHILFRIPEVSQFYVKFEVWQHD